MTGYLDNLAARARGTLPRLTPRRPAPFEERIAPLEGFETTIEIDAPPPTPRSSTPKPRPSAGPPETETRSPPAPAPTPSEQTSASQETSAHDARTGISIETQAPHSVAAPPAATPAAVLPAPAPATAQRRMAQMPAPAGQPTPRSRAPAEQTPPSVVPQVASAPPATPALDNTLAGFDVPPLTEPPQSTERPVLPRVPDVEASTLAQEPAPLLPEERAAHPETMPPNPGASPPIEAPEPLIAKEALRTEEPVETPAPAPLLPQTPLQQVPTPERETKPAPEPTDLAPETVIEVTIGQIEVVNDPPPKPLQAPAPPPLRGISLDDFLDGRDG
ncbi:MAG: hypothetical protein AAGE61_12170 [Pseudomonadota bacterium]